MNKTESKTLENNFLQFKLQKMGKNKQKTYMGSGKLQFSELLKQPIQKTNQSYIRSLDQFINILDDKGQQVAILRVIIYLEDLGPSDQLPEIVKEEKEISDWKDGMIDDLQGLEQKVLFELENWKIEEKRKFELKLQQKKQKLSQTKKDEFYYMNKDNLIEVQSITDRLKKTETKLLKFIKDLQGREQQLVIQEEEVKKTIDITAKKLSLIEIEKRNYRQIREDQLQTYQNTKSELELKDNQLIIKQRNKEYEDLQKTDQQSPMVIFKSDLNDKQIEIADLKNQILDIEKIKDQYKEYCEKLKQEIIKLKEQQESQKYEVEYRHQQEMQKLHANLYQIQQNQDKQSNYYQQQQIQNLKSQEIGTNQPLINNKIPQTTQKQYTQDISSFQLQSQDLSNFNTIGLYEKLVKDRQELIDHYGNDPNNQLINQYDQKIKEWQQKQST